MGESIAGSSGVLDKSVQPPTAADSRLDAANIYDSSGEDMSGVYGRIDSVQSKASIAHRACNSSHQTHIVL